MATNSWATTWRKSALTHAGIEPTPYALKVLALWQKSTPLQPWTYNPLGIPQKGYATRAVPNTRYALFQKYSDFYTAFAKAMATERQGRISSLIQDGKSTSQLWRELNSLEWPGADSENDWPTLVHGLVGNEFREMLGMPPASTPKTSGTTGESHLNNRRVMDTQRAMVTAAKTKMDLTKAIAFITIRNK